MVRIHGQTVSLFSTSQRHTDGTIIAIEEGWGWERVLRTLLECPLRPVIGYESFLLDDVYGRVGVARRRLDHRVRRVLERERLYAFFTERLLQIRSRLRVALEVGRSRL